MDDRLTDEYLQLQKTVEDFDTKALSIKTWSVTLSAAGLVAAYVENQPSILVIAAVSALIFWLIEALWKTNQNAFYARIYQIEEAFQSNASDLAPFQIASSWSEAWRSGNKEKKLWSVLFWPHIFLPHIVVAAGGFILYFFMPPLG